MTAAELIMDPPHLRSLYLILNAMIVDSIWVLFLQFVEFFDEIIWVGWRKITDHENQYRSEIQDIIFD